MTESNFPNYNQDLLDPTNLWEHQRKVAAECIAQTRWIHRWDPRVGKTRLTHAEMLGWLQKGYTRFLVTAPQTVCSDVWYEHTYQSFPPKMGSTALKIVQAYSGKLAERKALLRAEIYHKPKNQPTFIIVNRDSISALIAELLAWGPEVFILDELHDYKTPSSARHRAALRLANSAKIVRGLTGTIMTKNYGDIYGQAKVIKPEIFGTSQDAFRKEYIIEDPRFKNRVIGYRNLDNLFAKLNSFSDIKLRKDCFDIPSEQEIIRRITLPDKARVLYKQIKDKHVAELNGKLLSADHALSRLTLLQQLAGGSIKHEDGTTEWIHDALLDTAETEAKEIIEQGGKFVIFYRFSIEGNKLHERLGGELLNGSTPSHKRHDMIKRFEDPDSKTRLLIAQEAVGSVGISLAAADWLMFYSYSSNFGIHRQAKDRIFKPGGKLGYIYLQAKNTVHQSLMAMLRGKQNASDVLAKGVSFEYLANGGEDFT